MPSGSEVRAQCVVQHVTGRRLIEWDVPPRQNAVDFRDPDAPELSLEVKRWTCEGFQRAIAQWREASGWHPDARLARRWHVSVTVPTTTTDTTHPGIPRFRSLVDELVPLISDIELSGAMGDIDLSRNRLRPPYDALWRRWKDLVPSGMLVPKEPFTSPETPLELRGGGVDVSVAYGAAHSFDPNSMSTLLDDWLHGATHAATNLRDKIRNSADPHNDGFLVLDSSHDSWWMLHHWGCDMLPTLAINLPSNMERIWLAGAGDIVWWYSAAGGWNCARVP